MFHARDGWTFGRAPDGSVLMRLVAPVVNDFGVRIGAAIIHETVLPANEWASVVAEVRAGGATGPAHKAALDFHQGAPPE